MRSLNRCRTYGPALFVQLLALAACGDDGHGHEDELEDPSEHACEHASESGRAVTASEFVETAVMLALGDEPATVALVPGTAGYVALEAPAEALLFAGHADVVTGLSLNGEEIDLPSPTPNEFCPNDIPEHYDLDLEEPGAYVLKLGPAGVGSVWLVYTAAAGHGH